MDNLKTAIKDIARTALDNAYRAALRDIATRLNQIASKETTVAVA